MEGAAASDSKDGPRGGPRPQRRILSVDDDPTQGRFFVAIFRDMPEVAVSLVHDGAEALQLIAADPPDLVLLDLGMPNMDGIEVLTRVRTLAPGLPVIVITGFTDVRLAVQAIQLGAYQFLTKPVNAEELTVIARRAFERSDLLAEIEVLRRKVGGEGAIASLAGGSPAMQQVVWRIRQVAPSSFTVLIEGETGAGKEVVSRAIHEESTRAGKPLVAVDCGAIPENLLESELFGYEKGAFSGADKRKEGLFVLAEGGTVLLDEIGNLPIGTQAKLLRVLQERKVMALGATSARNLDVRFIAATNASLEQAVRDGRFRQDLYYRLQEFRIGVPALRERPEDILGLANRFRAEASLELRRPVAAISEEAAGLLKAYTWPGNVRELRNIIRQAVLLAQDFAIEAASVQSLLGAAVVVPAAGAAAAVPAAARVETRGLKEIAEAAAEEAERQAIRDVLQKTGGNKSQAARILRVDYKTLHLKVKRYGLGAVE
jgi:DNA-binding NtrC family response regulator